MHDVPAAAFQRIHDPSHGEAEPWYVNDHTFVRGTDGTWHLFGITHAEPFAPFDELHLCHVTAPALHGPWTKQPFALSTDPAWGETHLWAPHVVAHDGVWWMFVCAGGPGPAEYRIHALTSEDLWTWERHPENPVVVDGYEARDPMVLRVEDRWIMYYTATEAPEGGHHVVVATESTDLLHWSGRTIVHRDESSGTGAGPTESPFVHVHDGVPHLLIGPDFGPLMASIEAGRVDLTHYRRTRVIRGRSFLDFRAEDQVATVDAHAAEIVTDEDGTLWVSHCGWGMGGVFLAPISFDA